MKELLEIHKKDADEDVEALYISCWLDIVGEVKNNLRRSNACKIHNGKRIGGVPN